MFDISSEACTAVQSSSISVCKTLRDVAEKSEYVVTMLPNNDIVSQTYETMVADGMTGKTFIDSSTIDPNVAKSVSNSLASNFTNTN